MKEFVMWHMSCNKPGVMNSINKSHSAGLVMGIAIVLWCDPALAQRPIIEGAAGAGTGASFGSGDAATVVMQSPTFVDIDVIYSNDEAPALEYAIGFQAELQGRVTAGIIPQLRLTNAPKTWTAYGLIGVPFVVAPRRLLGVEAGGGILWCAMPSFGVYFEAVVDLFILGNDLPKDSIMVQLDGCLGVRIGF